MVRCYTYSQSCHVWRYHSI